MNSFQKYIDKSIYYIHLKEKNTDFSYNDKKLVEEYGNLENYIDADNEHAMALQPWITELDRYSDIHPYKYNTIYLSNNKYVNASSINIYKEKYFISTQGPKQETIEDFWTMVDENNVNVIAMICNEMENGIEKCSNYWSESNEMEAYKISIENTTIKKEYLIREIKLINNSTSKERIVKQIQFIGWPDHGVPDVSDEIVFEAFNEMIELVDKFREDSPIVVHCSAGVGRTGTFISMYCLSKEIKSQIDKNDNEKGIQFSIFNLVRKLKEMRIFSVQTQMQYNLIYQYVDHFLIKNNI